MPGDTFRLVTLFLIALIPVAMCISLITKRSKQKSMTKEELIKAMFDGEVTVISPPDPLLLAACSLVPRKNSTIPPPPKDNEEER